MERLIRESGGDDSQLLLAHNKIGQYYSDRHKWAKAAQYYAQVRGGARARGRVWGDVAGCWIGSR